MNNNNHNQGQLFVVATPIGNLEDITLRALRILKEVDIIVCEDSRITQRLLNHYEIGNQLFAWHANSSNQDLERIMDWLSQGKRIALVTDAGTPTISDPGVLLVNQVSDKLPEVKIFTVPGPSAFTAALSISGISSSQFTWYGFLPHKKGRQTIFKEIAAQNRSSVFYESPHRIEKTLHSLSEYVPNKKIVIARELTKVYEQVISGTAEELLRSIGNNQLPIKGEFVVIVE